MDFRRLLVLAAFTLVACGSAGASRPTPPTFAPSYVVVRTVGSPAGTDTESQRIREVVPRAGALPEVHRACALRRGADC